MKVHKDKAATCTFNSLNEGDVFESDKYYYIKTENVLRNDVIRNALNVDTGRHAVFSMGEVVTPITGAFVIGFECKEEE